MLSEFSSPNILQAIPVNTPSPSIQSHPESGTIIHNLSLLPMVSRPAIDLREPQLRPFWCVFGAFLPPIVEWPLTTKEGQLDKGRCKTPLSDSAANFIHHGHGQTEPHHIKPGRRMAAFGNWMLHFSRFLSAGPNNKGARIIEVIPQSRRGPVKGRFVGK